MSFRFPWLLLLLALVPLFLWLRYRKGASPSALFSSEQLIKELPLSWAVMAYRLLPWFYGAGIILLIVTIARPQKGLAESRVETEAVDIVLLVDVSTSMRALDFSLSTKRQNRLDVSKDVIKTFIENRTHDRMGIVAFAALPYTIAPLTLDHNWLTLQLARLKTGMLEDGTAIGTAIASAVNRLRDSQAESKIIILLTDGVNNAGNLSPQNAAEAAKALGIKIYTVGAGKEGIVPFPVQDPFGGTRIRQSKSEIDIPTLREIAKTTGAKFFRAENLKALKEVYAEIDEMEKTEIEIEQYTRYEELFQPFLWAGIFFLLFEKIMSSTRLRRIA